MLRVTILASGSSGNALLVEYMETRILVDAGVSAKRLTGFLGEAGIGDRPLDGVLLTHEHSDHARGLKRFCPRQDVPVYCNALTAEALGRGRDGDDIRWHLFRTGQDFEIGGIGVENFAVPHDASDPLGFVLHAGPVSLGILTDLGFATAAVLDRVADAHALVIEANHDADLLRDDPRRPWAVKQRITSRHGHLDNHAAAEVIAHCAARRLDRAVLGHLSRDCNRADLAMSTVRSRLDGAPVDIHAVEQDAAAHAFEIDAARPHAPAPTAMETPLLNGWSLEN